MNIPTLLRTPVVEKGMDGNYYFTPQMFKIFSQLFTQLQQNVGADGFVVSPQTAANIATFVNPDNFTLIGDSTNNLLKVFLNGSLKTVTTS